ncbi:MAG: peptidoglycan D,D-transpeptidase FtsI family protein [Candidatus Brocadiia bacterium]
MERHRGHKVRVYLVAVTLLAGYAALFSRLCVIQGMEADHYKALARAQQLTRVRLVERRGTIYEHRGRPLAVSVPAASVFANPRAVVEPRRTARRLGELLDLEPAVLLRRFRRRQGRVCIKAGLTEAEMERLRHRPIFRRLGRAVRVAEGRVSIRPQLIAEPEAVAKPLAQLLGRGETELAAELRGVRPFVWVKRKVSPRERKAVALAGDLQGIGVAEEYQRTYPHGVAAELVGFVGIDENGLEGLELALDDILAGQAGYAAFGRDAAGRFISDASLPREPALPGRDVQLTLDAVVQTYAEEALREAWDLWAPKAATAVVLDPATGDLLAAACVPSFDPNDYADMDPRTLRQRCRARYVADWMEPGSIMKPFVLSGVLAEGLVREDDVIFCENGVWMLGSRRFHDHHAYGNLTVAQVIVKSSNIGAAKLGCKLGGQRLHRILQAFGFGRPTGFILPGENPGLLRPPSKWTSYSVPSISIGQEVCVNVLQMTLAYAAIANDGLRMRPRVVCRVRRADGTWEPRPPRPAGRAIAASVARRVRRVLFRTVEEGTGRRAKLDLFSAAGKTGTAQKPTKGGLYSHSKVICSFVAMAPVERPRVVVMVSVDEPTKHVAGRHFGGTVAAPVVGQILNRTLAYLEVEPDKPEVLARMGLDAERERATP